MKHCNSLILLKFLILATVSSAEYSNSISSKLRAVAMITRHGDRSPIFSYPLDPHRNHQWPGGLGALSERGANQLYQSGLLKSTRYSPLFSVICLNDNCTLDLNKILVISSSVQRCIDSAQNFLRGFLRTPFSEDLVNVIPEKDDEMLISEAGKPCPKLLHINADIPLDDPHIVKVIDFTSIQGEEFKSFLQNNTGMEITSAFYPLLITDILQIERDNNLTWPSWVAPIYDKYLMPLTEAVISAATSKELYKLRSGVLLRDMIDRLSENADETSEQNIVLYSAHDTTIAGLLHVLEITNQTALRPAYGAMFGLELYENGKIRNDFEIKLVYFMNYGDSNPIEIRIPNCMSPCPFKIFKKTVQPKLTKNYDDACAL